METSDLNNELIVCNHETRKKTDVEISDVQICADCNAENEPTKGKANKDPINNGETSVSTIHMTYRQTTRGKILAIEEITVQQTKKGSLHEFTTQVGMGGAKLRVYESDVYSRKRDLSAP